MRKPVENFMNNLRLAFISKLSHPNQSAWLCQFVMFITKSTILWEEFTLGRQGKEYSQPGEGGHKKCEYKSLSVQLNYIFLPSKHQVAIIIIKSTHDFCTVSLLGVLWEPLLLYSKLTLHYVLIRLSCITWIWDHPKSHGGETNEPKCWAAALKTRWEKSRVFWWVC